MAWEVAGILVVVAAMLSTAAYLHLRRTWPREDLPAWLLDRPIAHRGLHDADSGVPENSLPAFEAAAAAGYPVELDVHLLADGRVAVFHDFSLERMTGDRRRIEDCTARQIAPLRLAGSDQPIPLLGEALGVIAGRVGVLIELKSAERSDRRLERAVARRLKRYRGDVAVQSFNPFSLAWFRAYRPELPRGQLACDARRVEGPCEITLAPHRQMMMKNLMMDSVSRPAFISYHAESLPSAVVALKRRRGLPVLAWTVSSPDEQTRLSAFCDNFIFEGYKPAPRARA